MSSSARRSPFSRVLVDMNTQCDFLLPRGALPVVNRLEILPNIRKIMNWGRIERIPVISSLECHRNGESSDGFPAHCIDRSTGQKKLPFTLMSRRIVIHGDNTLDLPLDPFRRFQQVIFTKRSRDFLSNPKADRLLNAIKVKYAIVFGVLAEHCVKIAVLGLLARRRRIIVVKDACGYWCAADGELAFRQMGAKGAILATTEELLSGAAEANLRPLPPLPKAEEEPMVRPAGGDNGRGNGGRNGRPLFQQLKPTKGNGRGRTPSRRNGKTRRDIAKLLELRRRKGRSASQPQTDLPPGQA